MPGKSLPEAQLDLAVRGRIDLETAAWAQAATGMELPWALDYFVRFYHRPLMRHLPIEDSAALECACGFGINAIAYVLAGGRQIAGYDLSPERVAFANELSRRLGLDARARFFVADIAQLPEGQTDVVFSLQTLEHVPDPLSALRALSQRAQRAMALSTPNRLFPRDGHDTGLMFAHWLPQGLRKRYAELRGAPAHQLCRFLAPLELEAALPAFQRVTQFYNFDHLGDWLACFPCYFPYGTGGGRWLPERSARVRWRLAGLVQRVAPEAARQLAPMIEGIFLRRSAG